MSHQRFLHCLCLASLLASSARPAIAAGVSFATPNLQLGSISNGQIAAVTFVLTNDSEHALKILTAMASCRCTSLEKSPDEIPAHGSGSFEWSFNSSRSAGQSTQSVEVETADGQTIVGQFHVTVLSETQPRPGGISGPGKPLAADGRFTIHHRATSNSAVKQGLLPPIRPLVDLHIRDTVVILGGDGNYYLTGSTGDDIWAFNDGVELWRSADLKKWDYLGLVWTLAKDATWEKQPRDLHGKPTVTIWAPEIHYLKKLNTYVICLSMAPGGISLLKSTTGKPEGPYVNAVPGGGQLRGGIDATIFEDDDGKVYFTNSGGGSISLMKDDLSGFAETRAVKLENPDHNPTHHAEKVVRRGMNGFGHEGAVLFKANGKYYHGAVDDYEGRYSSCVAMADNIWGPYTNWHETVPCGGGTNFFQDKEGNWWCAFFGNDDAAPWRELPGIVRVEFDSTGKISIAKNQPDFVLQKSALPLIQNK